VDLHKTVIQVCVLNGRGEVIVEQRFEGSGVEVGDEILAALKPYRRGLRMVVEAVGVNRWFVAAMRAVGTDLVVADPARLGLKQSGKKTDRRDAHELARRLYLGDIERSARSYHATEEEYGQRKVLRIRHQLVVVRQRMLNQIRGLLNAQREIPPVRDLWRRKGLAWLRSRGSQSPALGAGLNALANVLEETQQSIEALDKIIEAEAETSKVASLLVAVVPSMGAQTALTVASELGDVRRFSSSRAAVSQAGLAPRVANSADKQHHGRIIKKGSSELRWILSQMAVRLLARNELVKLWAAPYLKRMHANKVRIALARRLLVGIFHMLTTGEEFCLQRCLAIRHP
jgi:transposase